MITYAYPPVIASGSNRSLAFSKNLPMFGWEPTVLTVDNCRSGLQSGEAIPEGIRIVRTKELNLHGLVRLLHGITRYVLRWLNIDVTRNWYSEFLCIPDAQIAWATLRKGVSLARTHDVIYASCSPFSSAIAGAIIKKFSGKPLVIDFRDAWSLNPHMNDSMPRRAVIRRLERYVLQQCDKLIVNTPGAETLYKTHYPEYQTKILSIPNGYDSLNLAHYPPSDKKFTIMHVGNFYGSRVPDALLEALGKISEPSIEFVHVGAPVEGLISSTNVRIVPTLRHEAALELMRTASLLYLKQGFEAGVTDYIAVAAKTYEYLATGLPILADCPEGDNAAIVRKYCAHPYVVTTGRAEDLRSAVLRAFAARNETIPHVTDEFRDAFNRTELTRRLACVFGSLVRA